jgi:hypothetical protein
LSGDSKVVCEAGVVGEGSVEDGRWHCAENNNADAEMTMLGGRAGGEVENVLVEERTPGWRIWWASAGEKEMAGLPVRRRRPRRLGSGPGGDRTHEEHPVDLQCLPCLVGPTC